MAALSFKKAYIEPIQRGEKRQTLRAREPRFKPGDEIVATCRWGDPPFATLVCTRVAPLARCEITDHVAHEDGFPDGAALKEELGRLYPGVEEFWLIQFELRERRRSSG